MAKRRPVRVEYKRIEYYGYGRRAQKQYSWWLVAAGVVPVLLVFKAPVLALLIGAAVFWYWRSHYGRRR